MSSFPSWSTAEQELEIVRAALHLACKDMAQQNCPPSWCDRNEQDFVDYYISRIRANLEHKPEKN